MTLSRPTVEGLAALCAAVPDLAFTVTTASGGDMWVAEHPDARLCVHAFRHAIAEWPAEHTHSPCIEAVEFDAFEQRAGVLQRLGERWFVSPLGAEETAACLRGCAEIDSRVRALVRADPDFGLSVVRLSSDEVDESTLDDGAFAAYAACLTEDLCGALRRAS